MGGQWSCDQINEQFLKLTQKRGNFRLKIEGNQIGRTGLGSSQGLLFYVIVAVGMRKRSNCETDAPRPSGWAQSKFAPSIFWKSPLFGSRITSAHRICTTRTPLWRRSKMNFFSAPIVVAEFHQVFLCCLLLPFHQKRVLHLTVCQSTPKKSRSNLSLTIPYRSSKNALIIIPSIWFSLDLLKNCCTDWSKIPVTVF